MCGIAGIRRFGPEPITKLQLDILLCANEHRGNDATGLALQNPDGKVHVFKQDEPAWNVVKSKDYNKFLEEHLQEDTLIALCHTRKATRGTPTKNENNHPVFAGKTAIVHNGMLHNDDQLFREMKLKREAEVDSDIIRAILDEHGLTRDGLRQLRKLNGSAAIAAISSDFPGKLLLARSGSPIVLASSNGQLLWSSEKSAIHEATRPWYDRFGLPMQAPRSDRIGYLTMPGDEAYLFGEVREEEIKGQKLVTALEWRDTFNTASYYTPPTYNVRKSYSTTRGRFYHDSKPDVVQCRGCKAWLVLPERMRSTPLHTLHCTSCKTMLADPPVA